MEIKMNHKSISTFLFFFFILAFFYSNAVEQTSWDNCDWSFKTRKRIEKWLNESLNETKEAINNGREYNGKVHKLEQCKINEINSLFNRLKFEYDCACGDCGTGGPSHPYAVGIPAITVCQPLAMYLDRNKDDLDEPQKSLCGCIQGLILHELVHAAGDSTEEGAVDCAKILYPCANDPGNDQSSDHRNCKCCEKKG
jgi:hypothetical protein